MARVVKQPSNSCTYRRPPAPQTNQLSTRMSGHRHTVANNKVDHPVAEHAAQHNVQEFDGCFTTRAIWILPPNTSFSELRRWERRMYWRDSSHLRSSEKLVLEGRIQMARVVKQSSNSCTLC